MIAQQVDCLRPYPILGHGSHTLLRVRRRTGLYCFASVLTHSIVC
jgi:hypothetical protein